MSGYKVVHKRPDGHRASVVPHPNGVTVYYEPLKWAKPFIEKSKLFLFDSFDHALAFVDTQISMYLRANLPIPVLEIWKARTRGVSVNGTAILLPYTMSLESYREFWELMNSDNFCITYISPPGTIVADEIMLVKYLLTASATVTW